MLGVLEGLGLVVEPGVRKQGELKSVDPNKGTKSSLLAMVSLKYIGGEMIHPSRSLRIKTRQLNGNTMPMAPFSHS